MILKFHRKSVKTSTLIIPVVSDQHKSALSELAKTYDFPLQQIKKAFESGSNQVITVYPSSKETDCILFISIKDINNYSSVSTAFSKLSKQYRDQLGNNIGLHLGYIGETEKNVSVLGGAVNGLLLGTYKIGLYKTEKKAIHPLEQSKTKLHIISSEFTTTQAEKVARKAIHTAETQIQIMDMVNAPGNKLTPGEMAKIAVANGKEYGFKTKVLNKSQIVKTGLNALLAVNRGSEYPPAFIIMEYQPKRAKKGLPVIGLVGKGVTFDTGGLSIKGATNMHYMKSDMGGAAAVLGTITLAARLQLAARIIAIIPTTDNCVDANAIKPGDIIHSYSGKTIEVIDTDAEGRLILADGLAYMVKNYKPDTIIDLATLTGSCVRALGYEAAGLFSNNQDLANQLLSAGESSGERLWQLPIWENYGQEMESDVADIKNLGTRPVAGAITAAKFLQFFTDKHPRWAHMDIAGVAFGSNHFSKQKSATGYGIRLLTEWIEQLS